MAVLVLLAWATDVSAESKKRLLKDKFVFFDIREQPLSSGLVEFGVQSKVNIIVPSDLVVVHQTQGVYGRYSISRALTILLKGSDFTFHVVDDSKTVVLAEAEKQKEVVIANGASIVEDELRIEDVLVVSARRKNENPQDVPISITVIDSEQIEKSGALDLVQLGQSMANVTLKVTRGTNTTLTAYIRGIGAEDPLAGFERGVGIYIDDVYLNRPQGAVLDVFDLERVEVLRGPQGVFYGRNTVGGAVKYVTKRLDDHPMLSLKAAAGSYQQRDYILSASTPVGGNFKVGASLGAFKREGFGKNLETGEDNYDKDIVVGRVSVESSVSDNIFFRLLADATEDNSSPKSGSRFLLESGEQTLSNEFDTRAGISRSNHPIEKNQVKASGVLGQVEWVVSPEMVLESITAYREDDSESLIDFDGMPEAIIEAAVVFENRQFSQELKVNFEHGDVEYLLGVYYLGARSLNAFDVELDNVVVGNTGVDPAYDGGGTFTFGDVDLQSLAGFFSMDFTLGESFRASLGGRYTSEKKDVVIARETFLAESHETFVSPYFGGENVISITEQVIVDGVEVVPEFRGLKRDSKFTPVANVGWYLRENVNLYASYSNGFKSGGFDPRGNYTVAAVREGFEAEEVDAYEIGVKSQIVEGKLSSNISVFYNDYKNVQIPGSVPVNENGDGVSDNFIGSLTNAAKGKITGAEVLMSAFFNDTVSADIELGVLNSEYQRFIGEDGEDLSEARRFPSAPDITMSMSFKSIFSLLGGELTQVTGFNYRGRTWLVEVRDSRFEADSYGTVNASFVWENKENTLEVGLFGKNLTDSRYKTGVYSFDDFSAGTFFYGEPRTITLSLKRAF